MGIQHPFRPNRQCADSNNWQTGPLYHRWQRPTTGWPTLPSPQSGRAAVHIFGSSDLPAGLVMTEEGISRMSGPWDIKMDGQVDKAAGSQSFITTSASDQICLIMEANIMETWMDLLKSWYSHIAGCCRHVIMENADIRTLFGADPTYIRANTGRGQDNHRLCGCYRGLARSTIAG